MLIVVFDGFFGLTCGKKKKKKASRVYFGDNNVDAMFAILSPLHEMIEAGATTLQEVQFAQAFGADLAEAWVTKTTMEIFFFFFGSQDRSGMVQALPQDKASRRLESSLGFVLWMLQENCKAASLDEIL